MFFCFFFQAEDGIRYGHVTGVQTCALPILLEKVGEFYYGEDGDTLQEKVKNELKKSQLWIASAESLTGGQFTEKLVSVPGASEVSRGGVICYDSSVKINLLDVPAE